MIYKIESSESTITKIKNETKSLYFTDLDIKKDDKIELINENNTVSFVAKEVFDIKESDFKCYPFLGYYAKNILEDHDIEENINKLYNFDLPEYTDETKCQFLFLTDYLEEFKNTGNLPDIDKIEDKDKYYLLNTIRDNFFNGCNHWLENIGYDKKYKRCVIIS